MEQEKKRRETKKRDRQKYEYVTWDVIPIESVAIVSSEHSCYLVSPLGDIFSYDIRTDKLLKMHPYEAVGPVRNVGGYYYIKIGYQKVKLTIFGKEKKFFVHRLVAMCFCENDDPKHKDEVDHKDSNRRNNRRDNLEWVSKKENRRRLRESKGWKPYSETRKASAHEVHRRAKEAHWMRKQRLQEVNLFNE